MLREQCRGCAGRSTGSPGTPSARTRRVARPRGAASRSCRCPGAGTRRDPGDREAPRPRPCALPALLSPPALRPRPIPSPGRRFLELAAPVWRTQEGPLRAIRPLPPGRAGIPWAGAGRGGGRPRSDAGAERAGRRADGGRSGWAARGRVAVQARGDGVVRQCHAVPGKQRRAAGGHIPAGENEAQGAQVMGVSRGDG